MFYLLKLLQARIFHFIVKNLTLTFLLILKIAFKKKQTLNIYKSQLNNEKGLLTIENIINISKYRGNIIGCKYAEAFEIIRMSI